MRFRSHRSMVPTEFAEVALERAACDVYGFVTRRVDATSQAQGAHPPVIGQQLGVALRRTEKTTVVITMSDAITMSDIQSL